LECTGKTYKNKAAKNNLPQLSTNIVVSMLTKELL